MFSRRGIHIKTLQLHGFGFVAVGSLVPLSCRSHPHAGRILVCELMVPRMQREFNQRSDAPYAQSHRQKTSGVDKMRFLLQGTLVSPIAS